MNTGMDRHRTEEIERYRYLLWLLVVLYVWSLPSAILVFNWLIDQLTLSVARWVPVAVITALLIAYVIYVRKRGRGWQFNAFLLPVILIVAGVVLLQSNPIKYIHIPEYALLYILVWLAFGNQRHSGAALLSALFCSVLLGITDELHQGFHPERYYGWKDMVVNAAGGLIGLLWVRSYWIDSPETGPIEAHWSNTAIGSVFLVLVISLAILLAVQYTGTFTGSYSRLLFALNIVCVVVGWLVAGVLRTRLTSAPALILALNHAVIVLLVHNQFAFR